MYISSWTYHDKPNVSVCIVSVQVHVSKDTNFAPPRLTHPSLFRIVQVFPAPQRWWDGDDPAPRLPVPVPVPIPPYVAKGYNCKFFIP